MRASVVVSVGVVVFRSASAAVPAPIPGAPRCSVDPDAGTVAYLVGVACPPGGFAAPMGYEPALVSTPHGWRYVKPAWAGGNCSGPLADSAHAVLRFGDATGFDPEPRTPTA